MQKSQPAVLQSALEELHDVPHLPAPGTSSTAFLLLLLSVPCRELKSLCCGGGVNDLKAKKKKNNISGDRLPFGWNQACEVFIARSQFNFLELLPSKRNCGGR